MDGLSSHPLINSFKNSFQHIDGTTKPAEVQVKINQECDSESVDPRLQDTDTKFTVTNEQFAEIRKAVSRLKILFMLLTAVTILLIVVGSVLVVYMKSENSKKNFGSISNTVTSIDEINKVFQEKLASNDFLNIVQKYIFCVSCEDLRNFELNYFESIGNNNCCIATKSNLIRLLQFRLVQNVNKYNSKVTSLQSSIEDLKEDINILENALFSSNLKNVTDGEGDDIPRENVMWATIQKNNRLINTLLNRRRSLLHLSGTAVETGIYWTEEVQTGELSYDGQDILVTSGGTYFIYCNIHISKQVCDGTDYFGYSIIQEFSPGEFLPIARAQKRCGTGSYMDTGLPVQSALQVELGQHKTLRIQFNRNSQEHIEKGNKLHDFIVFEI